MAIESRSAIKALRTFVNKEVPSKVVATTKQIAEHSLKAAIAMSPYNTGQFMASWRITIGTSPTSEFAAKGKRSEGAAAAEAMSASAVSISAIKFGQQFTLSNAAPHAQYVEYGSPTTQARYITRRVAMSVGGKYGKI